MFDYIQFFPYKKIRPEQDKVLKQIAKNWDNKKYFILQLDVGIGKSGIAKTICNFTKDSYLVTETKQLQEQYMDDFQHEGNMNLIKGKQNYICADNPRFNCAEGPCSINKKYITKCSNICPYILARNNAVDSQIVLTNYSYLFGAFEFTDVWKKRETIVFDESHLLENQLVSFAQFYLSPNELDKKFGLFNNLDNEELKYILQPFTEENFIEENRKKFDIIYDLIKEKKQYFDDLLESLGNDTEILESLENTKAEYKYITTLESKMRTFKNTFKGSVNEWLIKPSVDGDLVFTPLRMNSLFRELCDNWADKFVFMSATILDIEGYIRELGINRNQCCIITEDSSFDPKRSPIYYMPCGSMKYSCIDKTLDVVEDVVRKILNSKPTEKGIIHSGNYKIANRLNESLGSNRFITKGNTKQSNQQLLEKHIKSKKPTVLLSPSMTTGVDLKDDLARWQIVVKMPFGSLTDERIKKKSEIDPDWYACEALKTLVQACGRSTRSDEDYSTTYILDSSFKFFVKKYQKWLSTYFLNRIKGF